MSGLELCWETRILAGRDRPIYVILMSSNIDKQKLGEALDSGLEDGVEVGPRDLHVVNGGHGRGAAHGLRVRGRAPAREGGQDGGHPGTRMHPGYPPASGRRRPVSAF